MPTLNLREFQLEPAVRLTQDEVDGLRRVIPGMRITPSIGVRGQYDLVAGSTVGAARVGTWT